MNSSDPNDSLSRQEVDAALSDLSVVDWAKARSLARFAAAGLPGWTGDDLLSEAMTQLLELRRVWRRGVHPLVTLKTAMRSIASNAFRSAKNGPIDHAVLVDGDGPHDADVANRPAATPTSDVNPEQVADTRSQLQYLEELVADDEDAWWLVQLWAQGSRGKEAAEELGWDDKHYDAARQRLERRLQPLKNLRKTA
jgi:hypothetical protein